MERWQGKIAVVTGASSGIGGALVQSLLDAGLQVIGLARRLNLMEQMRASFNPELREAFHTRECDVSSLSSLKTAFQWIEQNFQRIHILINNAGTVELSKLLDEGNEAALKRVMDVNLMGAVFCTKEAFRLMKVSMADEQECHIVNVSSLLGHTVPFHIPACGYNLYPVAKQAVRSANEMLRRELYEHKLIRLSTISPGLTKTDFGNDFSSNEHLEKLPDPEQYLTPEDVSRGVLFILSSPPHVTIAELLMVPSREQY